MKEQCYFCPAMTKSKRKGDAGEHEACIILCQEHDISDGVLHPLCPVEKYKIATQEKARKISL